MITLLAAAIGLGVAAVIALLIRNDRLHVANGMSWLLVALIFTLLGFAPSLFDRLASWVGVSYPPALAFTAGFAVVVLKFLAIDIENSRLRMRLQRTVQRLAMAELEVRRLKSAATASDGKNTEPSDAP